MLAALALAGCASAPQRVEVAVPVPCRVTVPPEPSWATAALADNATIWDQVKALLAERRQRMAYEDQLRAAAQACQ